MYYKKQMCLKKLAKIGKTKKRLGVKIGEIKKWVVFF